MRFFTPLKTLKALPKPELQALIQEEYGLTLASVVDPKEYVDRDILCIKLYMRPDIMEYVFDLDYAEMTASPTSWKALWEYFEY
jgi:hypothetical protein